LIPTSNLTPTSDPSSTSCGYFSIPPMFDSLVWARMWEILEFSGCPPQLVAVIRSLHEHATIALRLNSEGDLAPEFAQMKGIRQGSGLSPCLFVLVLDFVMRSYMEACTEQGMDRTDTWNAYADDVVDKTVMRKGGTVAQLEEDASTGMQLLDRWLHWASRERAKDGSDGLWHTATWVESLSGVARTRKAVIPRTRQACGPHHLGIIPRMDCRCQMERSVGCGGLHTGGGTPTGNSIP